VRYTKYTTGLKVILDTQKLILKYLINPNSISDSTLKSALKKVEEVSKYINNLCLDDAHREAIEDLKEINKEND
jgi:hypothetical protein